MALDMPDPDAAGDEVGNENGRMENIWSEVSVDAALDPSEVGKESVDVTEIGRMEKFCSDV